MNQTPTFGSLLYQHRRRCREGQASFARMLGVTSGYICRLEHGQRHPSCAFVTRLVTTLKLTGDDAIALYTAAGYYPPAELMQQLEEGATTRRAVHGS
jgi:predicted transcriptional regulator